MQPRTQGGPTAREAVFSRTNTLGGFSLRRSKAERKRVRENTRSEGVTVRFKPEYLMHGKPQKAKSYGTNGKAP